MKKRQLIIIISIIIITALFIKVLRSMQANQREAMKSSISNEEIRAHSLLRLMPNETKPDAQGNVQVNVMLDSRQKNIESLRFVLFYDPQSLKFLDIQPQGVFSGAEVTQRDIHEKGGKCCHESGKITYALRIDPKKLYSERSENTPVVVMTFKALSKAWNTEVRFMEAYVNNDNLKDAVYKPGFNTVINFGK
jgi:hypothetical protein